MRKLSVLFLGIFGSTAAVAAPGGVLSDFGKLEAWKSVELEHGFMLSWQVVGEEIGVELSAPASGWIGFGVGAMADGDMVVGAFDEATNTSWVNDMYAEGRRPQLDTELGGADSLRLSEVVQSEGVTTLRFVRRLDTGDAFDKVITVGVPTRVVFAHGPKDEFAYHGHGRRFATEISF